MSRFSTIVLILVLGSLIASVAMGEERRDRWPQLEWTAGVAVGPTYSKLSGDFIESADNRWGGFVGGWIEYRADDNWSIALEFNWVQKGTENLVTAQGDSLFNLKLGYLELPLLLNLLLPVSSNWDLGLYSGGTLALRTSCTGTRTDGTIAGCTQNIVKGTDWNIPFGAGVGYYVPGSNSAIILDARYSIGLTDIFKANLDAKNQSWQFLIRYAFVL